MKQNSSFKLLSFVVVLLFVLTLLVYDIALLSSVGVLLVLVVLIRFINALGNAVPILELILFVSGVQWVVGPFFIYRLYPGVMGVPESEYMTITVIAYVAFMLGCFVFRKRVAVIDKATLERIMAHSRMVTLAKTLFWVGLLFFFVPMLISTPFDFVFKIIAGFSYIGAILLLYSKVKNKLKYVLFVYGLLFLKCIVIAVFAEFIAQSFLLMVFIPNRYAFSKKKILLSMLLGVMVLSTLNVVKTKYREVMWASNGRSVDIGLFFSILFDATGQEKEEKDNEEFLRRVSSGVVNSYIFNYTPAKQEHTHGAHLWDDFINSVVPRILYPDKKKIDNQANFMRFTGRYLGEGTSVGVNALGIGYAEFGVAGSYVFMFCYGVLLCLIFNLLVKSSKTNIIYLFCILPIFLSAIKAEAEFVGALNGLLKVLLFMIIINSFIYLKYAKLLKSWQVN